MNLEQYFKDKINWKVFNKILDNCTELEDNDIPYTLSVEVGSYVNISTTDYHTIYRYDKLSEFNGYIVKKEPQTCIDYYEQYGWLFYSISVYDTFDFQSVEDRLLNTKNIGIVDNECVRGFRILRFKEKN